MTPETGYISTSDGFSLNYSYTNAGTPIIIFCHGMTVDKDDEESFVIAESVLHVMGISTIRFDFRAHGKSSGSSVEDFTISGELEDLEAVYDFVVSRGHKKITLSGASLGGAITALFAGYYPDKVQSMILLNPALDFRQTFLQPTTVWGKGEFKDYAERLEKDGCIRVGSRNFALGAKLFSDFADYTPYVVLGDYKNPLLIVQGSSDEKVDPKRIDELFIELDNDHKELEVLRGAQHGFHEEPFAREVAEMIAEFAERTLL